MTTTLNSRAAARDLETDTLAAPIGNHLQAALQVNNQAGVNETLDFTLGCEARWKSRIETLHAESSVQS
jgi:hypothetical protein